ncbi:MAG TPA: bifunctional glycosyltransferase/class I SAM-dependent methyltransferase [Polyangiaceae bacterium]|nr:bifunctional glycosyltransferase/class I SAM-dependent methyltransferase [Polyangiaceae bacterium]
MPSRKPRVVIFIVAYYAESTLKAVLERIPSSLFDDYDCSILVVDDASEDRTLEVGREYQREHPTIPLTVLRNEYNQGYGGNQKVGYTHAIAEGADAVALLHGDGQYAPEELPKLLAPICRGEADAVFGSRMMERFGALRGGMPLYKYVGNKILTTVQNQLLDSKLSEFHSGYRVYSVPFLNRLQFKLNSNDFHFDSEIIIQFLNAGGRIRELPIPTYYGDEICRVNGMKYAKDVVLVTLQNVAHKAGLLHQRRFDPVGGKNTHYDLKLGYASSHSYALERIPNGSRVLDIGAGPGGMASELAKKHCDVTVVDQHAPEAPTPGVNVLEQDLDQGLSFDPGRYDVLLLLDVIEHLKRPEVFLEQLRDNFDHSSKKMILTTPNVAFVAQRLMLLLGQFNYGKAGILDATHTRLFTFRSISRLLLDSGFRITEVKGVPAPFPKVLGEGLLGKTAVALNELAIRLSKTLFSYQILIEAEGTPTPEFLVEDARQRSGLGRLNLTFNTRRPPNATA